MYFWLVKSTEIDEGAHGIMDSWVTEELGYAGSVMRLLCSGVYI